MKNNLSKDRYLKDILSTLVLIGIITIIFRPWFSSQALVGGDWGYVHSLQFTSFTIFPSAWETMFNLGYVSTPFIWAGILLNLYINFFGRFVNFNYISLFGFFIPFLFVGIYSIRVLMREVGIKDSWAIFFGTILYTVNTYVLTIVSGGQILVGLSYAIAPLVFSIFMRLIHTASTLNRNKKSLIGNFTIHKLTIYAGLILALQILFDPRIVYITSAGVGMYFLYHQIFVKGNKFSLQNLLSAIIFVFFIPYFIALMVHAVWIIPVILGHTNPIQQLGVGFSSSDAVKYFSFAKFEDTISLLHPNWPENIFGKVGFLKPEFLLLPILAFSSLLFVSKIKEQKTKINIVYFAILGLLGGFLAKGVNEPFGGIYLWMFSYIPGFVMFRDPTKWYTLVAVSYSILIPLTLWKVYELLKSKNIFLIKFKIFNISNLFLLITAFALLYLIRPAILGKLSGTLAYHSVDKSYVELAQMLDGDNRFSRTLWIPSVQRFGYYSNNHPAIKGNEFFKVGSLQDVVRLLESPDSKLLLQEAGIKYIIIPYDSEKEIFVKDGRYNEEEYRFAVKKLNNISWFKKYKIFGRIIVYVLESPRDRFWVNGSSDSVGYKMINPSEYEVSVNVSQQNKTLIFSEGYNSQWVARLNGKIIDSQKFHRSFNSFPLSGNTKNVKILFKPQEWVNNSLWISLVTLFMIPVVLILLIIKERNTTRNHQED